MMHLASGTQASPVDLTLRILKRRSRRSDGGEIVQELNSIREGKYWDDVKGGWSDPFLIRKAREEEMQYVKKPAVHEKLTMSQCGPLRKSLYGTRDAAQNWELEQGSLLEEIGLRRGQATTCLNSEEAGNHRFGPW